MSNCPSLTLENTLAASWPAADWRELGVLVAVSGGADSVAMACALARLKREAQGRGRLIVAHFNHRLRPEAAGDEAFVRDLAARLALGFECEASDVRELSRERGDGMEAAARQARYAFLQAAAERLGARYVATGHTADDQVETVLLNILRGTGLAGLAGIPRARPLGPAVSVIRPLLGVRRSEIIEYLTAIGQTYCTDVTNTCTDYSRNRVRHELLPLLRSHFNSEVDAALERLARIAADSQELIQREAERLLDRCLRLARPGPSDKVCLDIAPLQKSDSHLVREALAVLWRRLGWPLQDMGFHEWNLLAEMASGSHEGQAAPSSRVLPGNVLADRREDQLVLTRREE